MSLRTKISYSSGDVFEGYTYKTIPHGSGKMTYYNGDRYIGKFVYGKIDGYGLYVYADLAYYRGFFSDGKFHGLGTYETAQEITKGSWRNDVKHGKFHTTNKKTKTSHISLYIDGLLTEQHSTPHIDRSKLITTERKKDMKREKTFNIAKTEENCVVCNENLKNCCNSACGHLACCVDCLSQCKICPICRKNIDLVVRVYA